MSAALEDGGAEIRSGLLPPEEYRRNFADLHPPLSKHEALVEADRCYFCFDAPCMQACPTRIDIPLFIRKIQAHNPAGAGETILEANILGGMCARVCPVETLCEEACVRTLAEDKPVRIGMLQRYATDDVMERGEHPFERAAPTGRRADRPPRRGDRRRAGRARLRAPPRAPRPRCRHLRRQAETGRAQRIRHSRL